MNERIFFTNADGSVGVEIPSGEITMAELRGRVEARPNVVSTRMATIADLPSDRLFRGAWDDSNPEDFIGLNLVKAQAIAHDMRRVDRENKLAPLDKEVLFAGTSSARKTAINVERNDILNANAQVQIDIDGCADEAALRAVLSAASIT